MRSKKNSVGLQLLTKDVSGEFVAILQIRAMWNEENNSRETWPGVAQVTVHGGLEKGEDFLQALFREISEELDEKLVQIINKIWKEGKLTELVNFKSPEKQVVTYGAIINTPTWKMLSEKPTSASFAGFKLLKKSELGKIINLNIIDKKVGVTDSNTIAMFDDEKEAVRIAFEKLS